MRACPAWVSNGIGAHPGRRAPFPNEAIEIVLIGVVRLEQDQCREALLPIHYVIDSVLRCADVLGFRSSVADDSRHEMVLIVLATGQLVQVIEQVLALSPLSAIEALIVRYPKNAIRK